MRKYFRVFIGAIALLEFTVPASANDAHSIREGLITNPHMTDEKSNPVSAATGVSDTEKEDPDARKDSSTAKPQSTESKAAWDKWRQDIDALLETRFDSSAAIFEHGLRVSVVLTYTVTAEKKITNADYERKSPNLLFNTYAMGVVQSLNNDSLLRFPDQVEGPSVKMRCQFDGGGYRGWHDERDHIIRPVGEYWYSY